LPQPPQLFALVCTSMQAPLQAAWPAPHISWQVPALQTWPALQTTPQPPQLAGSVVVCTQALPHRVAFCAQAHTPALQPTELAPHALPQAPQLLRSLAVFTHEPLQSVWNGRHMRRHMPPLQTWLALQVTPQPPQFWPSLRVLTQAPLHEVRLGLAQLHAPLTHAPPVPHDTPHAPQSLGLVWVLAQVPLQSV
jgi:hypothetical protein